MKSADRKDYRLLVMREAGAVPRMLACVVTSDEDGRLRGVGSDDPLGSVACACYVRTEDEHGQPAGSLWGWRVETSRLEPMGLHELRPIVDTLARIDQAMELMRVQEGIPESFASFVNRFARAIGAISIGHLKPDDTNSVVWYLAGEAWYVVDAATRAAFQTPQESCI